MQTWKPSTCGCKFEVRFPIADEPQTFVSLIKKGLEHKTVVDSSTLYVICVEENLRRTKVLDLALQIRPNPPNTQAPLHNDALFTFDSSLPPRRMNLDIPIFTDQERTTLRRLIDVQGIKDVLVKG